MAKNNLQTASKKAILDSKLNQLDTLGTSKENFEAVSLSVIEKVAGEFIERVHQNIQQEGMNVTGKINDIAIQAEDNKVNIYAPSHIIYQDRGVSGIINKYNTPHSYTTKMPPMSVIKNWILTKNIQLKDNEKYYGKESPFKDLTKDKEVENVAWSISQSIFQKGLKPRNIYSKEIPKLIEDLREELGNVAVQQISQQINLANRNTNRVIIKIS